MLIRIVAVDRVRSPYIAHACADMRARLAPYYPCEEVDVRAAAGSDPRMVMRDEAARIARHLHTDDRVWLLERTGTQLSSIELAQRLADVSHSGVRRLVFVIAGAYGADASLRVRAEFLWSLSQLTFLHEWARAIVLEQLYRAAKISRNEPYHH